MAGPPHARNEVREAGPIWKRLAWMAGIWLASVAALGTVAMVIRSWLGL